jgi:hypothetical protein
METIVQAPFCPLGFGKSWALVYFLTKVATVGCGVAHVAIFARNLDAHRNTGIYVLHAVVVCHVLSAIAPAALTWCGLIGEQLGGDACLAWHVWIVFFVVIEMYALVVLYLHITVLTCKGDAFARQKRLLVWYAVPVLLLSAAAARAASQTDRSAFSYNDVDSTAAPCVCKVSQALSHGVSWMAVALFAADALILTSAAVSAGVFIYRVKRRLGERVQTDYTPVRIRWMYALLSLVLTTTYLIQALLDDRDLRELFSMCQALIRGAMVPALLVIFVREQRNVPRSTALTASTESTRLVTAASPEEQTTPTPVTPQRTHRSASPPRNRPSSPTPSVVPSVGSAFQLVTSLAEPFQDLQSYEGTSPDGHEINAPYIPVRPKPQNGTTAHVPAPGFSGRCTFPSM